MSGMFVLKCFKLSKIFVPQKIYGNKRSIKKLVFGKIVEIIVIPLTQQTMKLLFGSIGFLHLGAIIIPIKHQFIFS